MAGILYLTSVPKFSVVAPTNNAKTIEKRNEYNTSGSWSSTDMKFFGPAFHIVNKVKNIRARLSSEDKSVESFFDSQINGLYKVATIAAGAIRARLLIDPSNSTPS